MDNMAFLSIVRKKAAVVVLVGVLCAALSFVGLIVYSKNFRSGMDFLIVQNQSDSQDFYSMLKSTEYLGKVLNESVYSDKFIDTVIDTKKVSPDFLAKSFDLSAQDKKGRIDAWSKTVFVKRNVEAGIMHIDVLNDDQKLTVSISSAITDVLTQKNVLFRGGDEKSVEIRVLSGPILESNPSVKKIAVTTIIGFMAGLSLSLLWIFVKSETITAKKDDILVPYKEEMEIGSMHD